MFTALLFSVSLIIHAEEEGKELSYFPLKKTSLIFSI